MVRPNKISVNCKACGIEFKTYPSRPASYCSVVCVNVAKPTQRHGYSYTPVHNAWCDMRKRCTDPGHRYYHRYGGRGIRVCERWDVFENFLADMGERPGKEYSLERIDNDKDYEPGNCKWATKLEQSRNRSTSWRPDEDQMLAKFLADGLRHEDIAPLVGRTKMAVSARASNLGLKSRRGSGGRLIPLFHDEVHPGDKP